MIISGNIPNTLPDDTYEIILRNLAGKDVRYVVDATGDLLKNVLKYKPFFVKPNKAELEALTDRHIQGLADLREAAGQLQALGARNVLVSLGRGWRLSAV